MTDVKFERVKVRNQKLKTPAPPAAGPLKKKHPYYDYGTLLSHNAVYNFLVGGRGLGKTFGAKKRAIDRYLRHGEQFIYLRRYQKEMIARETFFADIQHLYPQWDFRPNGNKFEVAPASTREDKRRNWETVGYAIPLSTAQQQKSVAFPRVTTIIFDEFIIEKGVVHYLPDEATVFNNFFSTVDRWQDKTKVFFLANSVSIVNPYFLKYDIIPVQGEEWIKIRDSTGSVFGIVHLPDDKLFAKSVLDTRFGRFIEKTDYADYAVGNEFADNGRELVGVKNPHARHLFNLETRLGWFSVWQDPLGDEYYAAQRLPGNQLTYTLLPENVTEDRILLLPNDRPVQRLRTAFGFGRIKFDLPQTRNIFLDLFKQQR